MPETTLEEHKPVFRGDLDSITYTDIDAPIRDLTEKSCTYYTQAFGKASRDADEAEDKAKAELFQFLYTLTSFYPDYIDPASPYRPMRIGDGTRSLVPGDLHPNDYPAIRALVEKSTDHALLARLQDILWLGKKDHLDCRAAVTAYIASARELDNEDSWTEAVTQTGRALQLATLLGRKNAPFQNAEAFLLEAIHRDAESDSSFRTCQLLQVAKKRDVGDSAELASIANSIGKRVLLAKEYRKARKYWEAEAYFLKYTDSSEKDALMRAAETYIQEVEDFEENGIPSYMQLVGILKPGIEALRQAGESRDRINFLREKLAQLQEKTAGELQTFEHSVDISKEVAAAREHLSGLTLKKALLRLGFGIKIIDKDALRAEVLKLAEQHPMSYMINGDLMDSKGRTQAKINSLHGNRSAEDTALELEQRMFAHAAQCVWNSRAATFINPARLTLNNEHHPDLQDLALLVTHNPFVPPGHEAIFLRGIHAGFNEDFVLAAHLLVPQIENSIRYMLESSGVDISNLQSDSTQPVKVLGPLFDIPETIEIFGEDLCFELRGILIEKRGYNYRNQLAHGFLTEDDCYHPAAINIWWLTIRMCILMLTSPDKPIQ